MMNRTEWFVIYLTAYTRRQIGQPVKFRTKEEAEASAFAFNKFNQDQTWNHVVAYSYSSSNLGKI